MFKLKRMTALLMSVLLMGSTVCAPAMAAEVTGEEPENAAEYVTTEAAEPIEQGVEAEEADVFDTSETAEEEQPETDAIESQESSGESTAETVVGTDTAENEDEYLSLVVADGVTEDTKKNDAYDASAGWTADELASLPVLDTDVTSASDGCVMLGIPGEYIADQQAFLDRINEIRKEACEEGVINPSTGLPLTPQDYRPLKWSYDLEKVARIRAAESSMTGYHERANGASWQSVECDPFYLGECIAWNYSKSATAGISQWYAEKQYWVEGRTDRETGHYTNMILPKARYVGGATFWSPYTEYPNTTLLEYSFEEGLDESFVDMMGECIQTVEISESNLSGKSSIIGSVSGVKGDENTLLLTENALYNGPVFSTDTGHLLFIDGVSWSSSNSGIAAVSADGIVKARKCGSATITAQAENGSSASVEFTVEHVLQKLPAEEATCTEAGLTEGEKCSNCGKVTIEQETVPAKGHAYGSWKVTNEATCTAKGSKEKICANCGKKVTEAIPAAGHKWNEDYTVDIKPTIYAEGSESKHCSVCGEIDPDSVRTIPKLKGTWKKNSKGWWYDYGDGSYPVSKFESINGSVYYFNGSGYMVTGWQKIDGSWYYFGAGGAMQTGWQKIGGKWYYMNESGIMQLGWKQIGGRWYYFEANGAMAANKWVGNYYLTGSGAMATNTWIGQYYVGSDGKWIPGYGS
ncbi:MAG: Ig-like domain-containing protein [Lachnospiraceae bacterium]|nr:Ig-like domain-containing protein [Lachnospiraceae bacterium]